MHGIRDLLSGFAGEAGSATIVSALVFLAVFVTALVVGRRLLAPPEADARDARSAGTALLNGRPLASSAAPRQAQPALPGNGDTDPFLRTKRLMWKVTRILSALFVTTLVVLTFLSYQASTPGTGDILLTYVLGAVTLLAILHLLKLDRRFNPDPDPRLKAELDRSVQASLAEKIEAALSDAVTVQWNVASPEVHRIDNDGLALARSMAAEGKSIDEICQAMESGYAGWSPPHQQAFRNVMQAAIDHS